MNKTKQSIQAQTMILSTLRLDSQSQPPHKLVRVSRKRGNQLDALVTEETVSKTIKRIRVL